MDQIDALWQIFIGVFASFKITDLIDILLISFLIYKLIGIASETRAAQLLKGIAVLLIMALVSSVLSLKTVNLILSNIWIWGPLAIIVLFQPEIRRVLERVGRAKVKRFKFFSSTSSEDKIREKWDKAIHLIASSCESLSRTKTGALMVFERQTKLGDVIETGVQLNADVSKELIGNLFFKNSPLHDGAVILRDAKILSAACYLPRPSKETSISTELGTRHRAAIGMSEISDAIILIVSEETGNISIAEGGRLTRGLTKSSIITYLKDSLVPDIDENKKTLFGRKKQK